MTQWCISRYGLFAEFLYVLIRSNISDCNQVISMLIIIVYGDGLAQGFVLGICGGLVHNTIIGYANKLRTVIIYFITDFHTLLTPEW